MVGASPENRLWAMEKLLSVFRLCSTARYRGRKGELLQVSAQGFQALQRSQIQGKKMGTHSGVIFPSSSVKPRTRERVAEDRGATVSPQNVLWALHKLRRLPFAFSRLCN